MRPPCRPAIALATRTRSAGAFFGRRKGKKLRPRQAALFETLLPQLALDLSVAAPADLRDPVSRSGRCRSARDRVRWRRAPDRGGDAQSANRLHRRRAVRQRHGQGARGDRRRKAAQHPPASWRRRRPAVMAQAGFGRAGRSDLSRSMAEAPALETPFRAGRKRRRDRSAFFARAANFVSYRTLRTMPPGRWAASRAHACLHGRPSAPTIGASPGPDLTERVMRRRPSARAARHVI